MKTSIREALDEFAHAIRVTKPERAVISLLEEHINIRAPEDLNKFEQARFQAELRRDHRFCDIFPADRIEASHLHGFLMHGARRLGASRAELRLCGPMMDKLAAWLAEKGYWPDSTLRYYRELVGDEPGSDLADLDAFVTALRKHAADHTVRVSIDDIPDEDFLEELCTITAVEPGKMTAKPGSGAELTLSLPPSVTAKAKPGWDVFLELARVRGRWKIASVGGANP